nr:MAG TPA: hypothetical protein [Caudoviricetes sp.]
MRDSLIFYSSFAKAIKRLSDAEQLKALWAIIDYGLDDTEPEDDGGTYMSIFDMAKPQIDANIKRKADGAKGGRPAKHINIEETNGYENEKTVVKKKKQAEKSEDNSPVIGNVLLNDGTAYGVTEKALSELQSLYPAVNAEQELRNIIGWCNANPKNRKTRNGVTRFINNWFSRTQNSARKAGQQKKQNSFCNFEDRGTNYDDLVNNSVKEWIGGDA